MKTHQDCLVEGSNYHISLLKLLDKKIVDIHGYVSTEFGGPVFQLSVILFEDGSKLYCEGEHDMPYLTGTDDSVLQNIVDTDEN